MSFAEYDDFDALGLAELVRKKEVTPAELAEEAIARIERQNPQINAVVHKMFDSARERAKGPLPEGPFSGVPFLIKDLLASYEGEPIRSGSRVYKNYIAPHHSELVKRFLAAGLIVLGKTNTPEFGLVPTTEPELFGPTLNPWNLLHTAGGSSGGSAAAVAARFVPLASGGDGGGSIRIPSSCCGIFGLKPTRGLLPLGPDAGEEWQGFATEHVLTRSVRDSAAMLDATAGPDLGAYYYTEKPERPYLEECGKDPGKLRIAFSAEPYLPGKVHPDCEAALADAVKLLTELGHECVEKRPSIDGKAFAKNFFTVVAGETWANVQDAIQKTGNPAKSKFYEDETWLSAMLGKAFTAGEFAAACRYLKTVHRTVAAFMAQNHIDVLLSPTLAMPPVPIHSLHPKAVERVMGKAIASLGLAGLAKSAGALDQAVNQVFAFIPYTPVFNATGQPSMSVPLYWNAAGLPVGTMFTGRFGEDALLLQLASQLEKARPWKDKKPPVCRS